MQGCLLGIISKFCKEPGPKHTGQQKEHVWFYLKWGDERLGWEYYAVLEIWDLTFWSFADQALEKNWFGGQVNYFLCTKHSWITTTCTKHYSHQWRVFPPKHVSKGKNPAGCCVIIIHARIPEPQSNLWQANFWQSVKRQWVNHWVPSHNMLFCPFCLLLWMWD